MKGTTLQTILESLQTTVARALYILVRMGFFFFFFFHTTIHLKDLHITAKALPPHGLDIHDLTIPIYADVFDI